MTGGEASAAMAMRRSQILVVAFLVFGIFGAYEVYHHRVGVMSRLHMLRNVRPEGRSVLEPGQVWPAPQMSDLGGKQATIASKAGRLLYVNVFATWCPDCKKETPALQQLAHQAQAESLPLDVVGIDQQEDIEPVSAFAQLYGLTYPIFMDGSAQLSERLMGVRFIPTSFIIDSRGVVRARITGALTLDQMKAAVSEVSRGGSFAN